MQASAERAGSVLAQQARPARRITLRKLLWLSLWLALITLFVIRFDHDLATALSSMRLLGGAVAVALALFAAWTVAAAVAWKALLVAALPDRADVPTLWRLFLIRVQGQALNLVVPSAGLVGESVRALSAAKRPEAVKGSVVAIVLDNVATAVAGLAFSAAALPMLAPVAHKSYSLGLLGSLALGLLCIAASGAPFVIAPWLARLVKPQKRTGRVLRILCERRELRPAFRRAVAWHLLERVLGVGEVQIVMIALGVPATLGDSMAIAAVFVLISLAVFFVPAQIGAAELGVTMAAVGLGLPAAVGISVALVRRIRQLVVCIVGLGLLLAARKTAGVAARWLNGSRALDTAGGC